MKSYVICTSPRSGSTMLCKMLEATNVAGNPGSHFHVPSFDHWLNKYDLKSDDFCSRKEALEAVLTAAISHGTGNTDVFGLRLQRGSFAFFIEQLRFLYPQGQTDVDRIKFAFGTTHFIYLTRQDKLDQAISYIRAQQSGLWHRRADGSELERLEASRNQGFDRVAIKEQMEEFAVYDREWRAWFHEQSIDPIEITYETFANNPQKALREILKALGKDAGIADQVQTQTAKLADNINKHWREKFEAEPIAPN